MEAIFENLRNLRKKCGEEETIKMEDVEVCCTVGISPFHVMTAMNLHKEMKDILSSDDMSMEKRDINEKSKMDGDTALHIAVLSDNKEIIEVLVNAGADFRIRNDRGQTPFMLAVARGKLHTVNDLWKYRDKFDIDTVDANGNSALHLAAERKWHKCIQDLLSAGAKADLVNNNGQTALNIAAAKGDLKSVKVLVDNGASILREDKASASAILIAIAEGQKEITYFLISKLGDKGVDVVVESLVDNIKALNKAPCVCEAMLEVLVQMFVACVQSGSTDESVLKNKVVSSWVPLLKRCATIESSACEQTFCCICQLMIDVKKPELISEEFVQEFIDCKGPDITVDMLQTFMESKRGSAVIGAFCMLLPLCKISWGQKWLRKNYHKIVECYQFFDSTTELLDFPNAAIQKVRTIWQQFKQSFDTIQAAESKKHEAELLAEEEREKAKREKKNERKKKRERKREQLVKTKEISSPESTSVEEDEESEKLCIKTATETDSSWQNFDSKKEEFEKVLSKKELKMNKKKTQLSEQEKSEVEAFTNTLKEGSKDQEDDTFLNFRPNRGKPPGPKNKTANKIKPSDLPWRNLKKPGNCNTSPGKEFPKLCKEKFANMMKEVHEENEKTMLERQRTKIKSTLGRGIKDSKSSLQDLNRKKRSHQNPDVFKREGVDVVEQNTEQNLKEEKSDVCNEPKSQDALRQFRIRQVKELERDTIQEEKNFKEMFRNVVPVLQESSTAEVCQKVTSVIGEIVNKPPEISDESRKSKSDQDIKFNGECSPNGIPVYQPNYDGIFSTIGIEKFLDTSTADENNKGSAVSISELSSSSINLTAELTSESSGKIKSSFKMKDYETEPESSKSPKDGFLNEWNVFTETKGNQCDDKVSPRNGEAACDKNEDMSAGCLNSIWDLSPVRQDAQESHFCIPTENVSPVAKVNKKRSRATSTVPRALFRTMPDNLSPLEHVAKMNEENNIRSNLRRFMNQENNQDLQEIYGSIHLEESKSPGKQSTEQPDNLEWNLSEGSAADPVKDVTESTEYEFLSESRLKSTGSIKSDTCESQCSAKKEQTLVTDMTGFQFGYFSSGASASSESIHTATSSQITDKKKPNLKKGETNLTAEFTYSSASEYFTTEADQSNDTPPKSDPITTQSILSPLGDDGIYKPFGDSDKETSSKKGKPIDETVTCKFGVIGEPCPTGASSGDNYTDLRKERFQSASDSYDSSRLKPGDGDRLLDDEVQRELFGSRSYWKETSYFGYGWLDGLSQLISAQNDLTQTDDIEKIYHRYPVFERGMEYECFKKRRLEEQWQRRPIYHERFSCGEPVQVDQEKAFTLIPQHLLDSSLESETEDLTVLNSKQIYPLQSSNQPQTWMGNEQQQHLAPKFEREYKLFPVQQVSTFQTGDMCFPQPGIPVIGNQPTTKVLPDQQFHQTKLPAFTSDSAQTGQGDSHFYHDTYLNAGGQFVTIPGQLGVKVKPEISNMNKARSVPFLSSAGAVVDTQKFTPSFTQMTAEYLSETSDRSSLTSTTKSTINSFKSANELVCSRSDVSVSCDRLAESFVIGKGRCGTTIYESWTRDGRLIAIRRMKAQAFDDMERQLCGFVLEKVSHKNICSILEVKRSELYGFVVMERFKENLKHFITRTRAQGYHPIQYLISMCRGMIHGLVYLHNQKIYHGRLCPENILLAENNLVKLSDYGLPLNTKPPYQSTEYPDDPKSIWICSEKLRCGNEVNQAEKDNVFKADIQVAGMLIYYTLTLGDHPFGRCPEEIQENLSQRPGHMRPLGEELDDILPKMLSVCPDQRPTAENVKLHPFLWTDTEKFRFLVNVGHHLYRSRESKNEVSATLERCINDLSATSGKQPWINFTQTSLVQEITAMLPWIVFRVNVGGLLSFMEAVDTYQHLLSTTSQKLLGSHPEVYFLTRFPALPIRVHQLVRVLQRQLPVFLYPSIDC